MNVVGKQFFWQQCFLISWFSVGNLIAGHKVAGCRLRIIGWLNARAKELKLLNAVSICLSRACRRRRSKQSVYRPRGLCRVTWKRLSK